MKMKILVTGSDGFIGSNLSLRLKEMGHEVLPFDLGVDEQRLEEYVASSDFIVHLAGINRPLDPKEFMDGNLNLTVKLIKMIEKTGSKSPIAFSSSTQATRDNPYGLSKKAAEEQLFAYQEETGHPVYVFRIYNAFGKWCRPNYNSVIATFCHNVSHGIECQVNHEAPAIDFVYIDDICDSFIRVIEGDGKGSKEILYPEPHYSRTLDEIMGLLRQFKRSRSTHMVPEIHDAFAKKLYSTYLSYLDEDDFAYSLDPHVDNRGSFTEVLKTLGDGQMSINVSRPGVTKGNHYHHTKNEKFLVVHGTCLIEFRKVGSDKVISYTVRGEDMRVVDIPCGYTHSITNIGEDDSITLMWANELFDQEHPDTVYLPVRE